MPQPDATSSPLLLHAAFTALGLAAFALSNGTLPGRLLENITSQGGLQYTACLYDHTELTPILHLDLIGSIMGRDVGPLPSAPRGESAGLRLASKDLLLGDVASPLSPVLSTAQGERLAAYMIVALQLANVLPAYLMITTRTSDSLHPPPPAPQRYPPHHHHARDSQATHSSPT